MLGNLLVRLHSLGDVVLASGTAVEMQQAGDVSFATRPSYRCIVERIPGEVEPVTVSGGWRELRGVSSEYSTIVDLQNNFTTKLAFAGRNVKRFRFNRRLRYRVLHGEDVKIPWRASEYLRTWSDRGNPFPVLERREVPHGDRLSVGIVVGGRWPLKTIPRGVVAELSRLFCDIRDAEVFLIGDSSDIPVAQYIVEECGYRNLRTVTGEGSIASLIDRIEKLDLLISPDSGPAHLAMALGVPVQVVFTSTSPVLGFWPEYFKGAYMAERVPCRPCHRHGGNKCAAGDEQCRRKLVPRAMFEEAVCLVP